MIPTIRLAGVASQLLYPRNVGGRLSAVFTNIHNTWNRCLIAPNVPKNIFSKSKGGTLSPKHLERGGVEHPPPTLEGLREKIKCKCNAVSSQKTVNLVVYIYVKFGETS